MIKTGTKKKPRKKIRERLTPQQKLYIDKYIECGKGLEYGKAQCGKNVVELYQEAYNCQPSTARAHAPSVIKRLKETEYYKTREREIVGPHVEEKRELVEKCKISFENVVEFAKKVREKAFGAKQYKISLVANDQIAKLYGYYSEGKRKEEEEALTPLNVVNIKMS